MTDPEPPTANRIAGPEDLRAETPWALQERPIKTCLQFYMGNLAWSELEQCILHEEKEYVPTAGQRTTWR
jgi:hypothetical protein